MEKEKKTTNKKLKYGILGGIGVVVIIAIIAIVCLVMLKKAPEDAVEGMLTSLKEGDFEKAEQFVDYKELMNESDLSEEDEEMGEESQKLLFNKLSWNIKDVKKDGDTANVDVEITNKDFKVILSNYMQKALKAAFSNQDISEEEIENYLIEELKNEDVPTRTSSTSIQVTKQDGKWRVVANDSLANSLLTGLEEAMQSLNDMSEETLNEIE